LPRDTTDFRSVTAGGFAGKFDGKIFLIGKQKFLESESVPVDAELQERAATLQADEWACRLQRVFSIFFGDVAQPIIAGAANVAFVRICDYERAQTASD